MRRTYLLLIPVLQVSLCMAQNIGIGTTTPDASSLLELKSNTSCIITVAVIQEALATRQALHVISLRPENCKPLKFSL